MKTIALNYSQSVKDIQGGQRGDHRMARISLPLPKARLPDIQSAVAIFDCDGTPRLSQALEWADEGDAYLKGGKAYVTLTQDLTRCRVLRVQLECYGLDGEFIDRSPISERLKFEDSLVDSLADLLTSHGEPDIIYKLIKWMHKHPNLPALDNLGTDADGLPLWNNAPWPGSSDSAAPYLQALWDGLNGRYPEE